MLLCKKLRNYFPSNYNSLIKIIFPLSETIRKHKQNANMNFNLCYFHNSCHAFRTKIKYQPYHCLLNRLFGRRSKKTPKLRVTGLCAGNSPGTGGFPPQKASNAENVFILWRHHALPISRRKTINRATLRHCSFHFNLLRLWQILGKRNGDRCILMIWLNVRT